MSILTVAEFQEHFETDLPTAAIQRLIDDAESEVIAVAGDGSSPTELVEADGKHIFPSHPVVTVTSITENIDVTPLLLAADDYRIRYSGTMIERLDTGTNPASEFHGVSSLVYTVGSSVTANLKRVTIDLVKLAIQFDGLSSEDAGDYSQSMSDYSKQRKEIAATACINQQLMV